MDGSRRRIALGRMMQAIGLAIGIVALIGWALDWPLLYTFGIADYPYWPLAAVGNVGAAAGQMMLLSRYRRAALVALALPLLIGAIAFFETATGIGLGVDGLLFPTSIHRFSWPSLGRPAVNAALAMITIAIISLMAARGSRRLDAWILGLGTATIGLAWLSIGLLLFGYAHDAILQPLRLTSSLPASLINICLVSAAFDHRARTDPNSIFAPGRASARAIRIALPAILMLPVVVLPLQRALIDHGMITAFNASLLSDAIMLVVVVALISIGIGHIARDDDALLESQARLDHALEAHKIGLFDWETNTNKLRWSPGAEERLGVEVGSMNDFENWAALVPEHEAAQVLATIADASQRKAERYSFAYHIRRADGEMRNIEGSGRCFYDKRGELQRVTGVNIDATERVRHEAELARREAQWLSILRTVPDAMIVIDREGNIVTFSAAAERMFGYTADEVVGRSALMLVPETDAQVIAAQLALGIDIVQEQRTATERIFTAQCKDGTQLPVEYSVGQTEVDGAPIFTAFVRDISERQAAERRFSSLQQEYAHSARLNAVGELASGLAHELNQPLAAGANFLGVAEMMLENQEGLEPVVEMIAEANGQLQRAGEIIRRLRDFIAKTDIDMRVEPLDETLREAVALGLSGARKQQIEVSYDIAAGAETIFADRIQIQQVVVNLVRNAAEALRIMPPERRRIAIAARPIDTEMLEVSITDRGPGLPQEMLTALFEPFRSTKQGAGLGIGLSICRRIVEAHGGSFGAENVERGARFTFTLPRVSEEDEVGDACVTST